jgi:hypothetical protein
VYFTSILRQGSKELKLKKQILRQGSKEFKLKNRGVKYWKFPPP